MAVITRRNKNIRRPRKGEAEKRRRLKTQVKRLVALGVPEAKISKLNSRQVRELLIRPAKLKKG